MATTGSLLDVPHPPGDDIATGPTSARTSRTRVDIVANTVDQEDRGSIVSEAQEGSVAMAESAPPEPQVSITFLMISGKRRAMNFQPDTTVGRVKELVWNGWPSEWQDERPPAPSYLRLLYLGRMLVDDETLTKINLPTHIPTANSDTPPESTQPSTIIHLSVRPYAPNAEDDLPKKKNRRRRGRSDGEDTEAEDATPGGCCASCVVC